MDTANKNIQLMTDDWDGDRVWVGWVRWHRKRERQKDGNDEINLMAFNWMCIAYSQLFHSLIQYLQTLKPFISRKKNARFMKQPLNIEHAFEWMCFIDISYRTHKNTLTAHTPFYQFEKKTDQNEIHREFIVLMTIINSKKRHSTVIHRWCEV